MKVNVILIEIQDSSEWYLNILDQEVELMPNLWNKQMNMKPSITSSNIGVPLLKHHQKLRI